jgi:hypothetical protein
VRRAYTQAQLLDTSWWCPEGGTSTTCRGLGLQYTPEVCSAVSAPADQDIYSILAAPMLDAAFFAPGYAYPQGTSGSPAPNTILTDGVCGSACAIFSRFMQDKRYMRVATVGGLRNEPQQYGSFGGGEIWDTSYKVKTWLAAIAPNTVDDGAFPHGMPVAGQRLSFVPRLIYSLENATGLPMEFVFRAADIRLMYSRTMQLNETNTNLGVLYAALNTRIAACSGTTCNYCNTATTACPSSAPMVASCQAVPSNFSTSYASVSAGGKEGIASWAVAVIVVAVATLANPVP